MLDSVVDTLLFTAVEGLRHSLKQRQPHRGPRGLWRLEELRLAAQLALQSSSHRFLKSTAFRTEVLQAPSLLLVFARLDSVSAWRCPLNEVLPSTCCRSEREPK